MAKKFISMALIILMVGAVMIAGVGCEKDEGTFEKAGEKVDQAAEKAKDKAEDVGDKVEDATDKAEDKIDKATK